MIAEAQGNNSPLARDMTSIMPEKEEIPSCLAGIDMDKLNHLIGVIEWFR